MPFFDKHLPVYKPQKELELKWEGWAGGWNDLFDETELEPDEIADGRNVMLDGKGAVTGRWGADTFAYIGTGNVRGIGTYMNPVTDTSELLAWSDVGYMTKRSGASATVISGVSFASGYNVSTTQLGGYTYIVGGNRELTRYNGTTLVGFPTLSVPTSIAVTNLSGVSGTWQYSWRVSAVSNVGETLASESTLLVNLPQDLSTTVVKTTWVAVSAASGVLKGYQIYRGSAGGETWVGSVDQSTTTFLDYGQLQSDVVFPPIADTTGGQRANVILKLDDRLVLTDFPADPTLVAISARYPYESRFHWADGGGYARIAPDDGDSCTALGVVGSNVKGGNVPSTILIFKENSTYAMVLKTVTIGNYAILDPQYQQLMPFGTKSARSVAQVENDTFFLSRDGVYSVGSEPNFLNELRSKDISARVRPYIRGLSETNLQEACAAYIDHKYLLSFPSRKETLVYDYERRCWLPLWKTSFGITSWIKYNDSGTERWLVGCDDGYIRFFSASLVADSGTAFQKYVKTRKEDFGDWTIMKIINLFYILLRDVQGSVSVTVLGELRSGSTTSIKTFTITGSSAGTAGYGSDEYGDAGYGDSDASVGITSEDFIRYSQLFKTVRVAQIEVSSTGAQDNWKLINIRMKAQPLGVGSLSPDTRA